MFDDVYASMEHDLLVFVEFVCPPDFEGNQGKAA